MRRAARAGRCALDGSIGVVCDCGSEWEVRSKRKRRRRRKNRVDSCWT